MVRILVPVLHPHHHTTATTTTTQLFLEEEPQRGSIRFSTSDTDTGAATTTTTTSSVDSFLSFVSSDITSIALGGLGLLVVVIHRLSFLDNNVDTMALQTRTDLLAVFACGSVLLNGITKLDVTAALAESVVLKGTVLETPELVVASSGTTSSSHLLDDSRTISWGLESLLTATPAKTAILVQRRRRNNNNNKEEEWTVVARAGMVPSSSTTTMDMIEIPEATPILDRVGSPNNVKETYLPTLQALPGRLEFTYLPSNTQLALLIPIIVNNNDNGNSSSSEPINR